MLIEAGKIYDGFWRNVTDKQDEYEPVLNLRNKFPQLKVIISSDELIK